MFLVVTINSDEDGVYGVEYVCRFETKEDAEKHIENEYIKAKQRYLDAENYIENYINEFRKKHSHLSRKELETIIYGSPLNDINDVRPLNLRTGMAFLYFASLGDFKIPECPPFKNLHIVEVPDDT